MATDSKQVTSGARRKPPAAGMGRKLGSKNKATKAIKDMILGALADAGGQAYLARQANENPGPFMTLVGKVLPMQVTGADDKDGNQTPFKVEYVRPPTA